MKVIREKCSEALHIPDRFHIVAKMNMALDEIRAGESRRMAMDGRTPAKTHLAEVHHWIRRPPLGSTALSRGCGSGQNAPIIC